MPLCIDPSSLYRVVTFFRQLTATDELKAHLVSKGVEMGLVAVEGKTLEVIVMRKNMMERYTSLGKGLSSSSKRV
jgi:hypothetical protein